MTHPANISFEKSLKAKVFLDFLEVARNFCLFIEIQQSDNSKEFLLLTQSYLLTLYTTGRYIPDVELKRDVDLDVDISGAEMKGILKFIGKRVPFSYYWAVLNPVDEVNLAETATGDLIDDLGDIYKDLKEALTWFDKNDSGAKENAVWLFKFTYDNHWADHCIDALYVIHHYLQENR